MLLGLNGFKGSGKDTVADYLVANYDFEKVAFATKLKEATAALFDISLEDIDEFKAQGRIQVFDGVFEGIKVYTGRAILQRIGTEVGRDIFGKDFWLDQVLPNPDDYFETACDVFQKYQVENLVVSDVRFPNELKRVKDLRGTTWRIYRDGVSDGHASEVKPPDKLIDDVVDNTGPIESLYEEIDSLMRKYESLN
jgi:hypothetical protein